MSTIARANTDQLSVAEFGRRIALFQSRPLAPRRQRPAIEFALLDLFKHVERAPSPAAFEPWEAEMLETALQTWRRPREKPSAASFFARIFEALPTPVAVYCDEGTVWNQALSVCLSSFDGVRDPEAQRAYVERMADTVRGAADLRAPVLYYALGQRLYRLSARSFPELRCSAVYLFPDGRALPPVEPVAQQLLAYRLSGLSIKQIAPLLGITYTRAEGISKRSRRHLMRLRSESCPEAVG